MILILPLVWSVPMAFVASELGSMVPEAGGLYRWIRRGMGEYWSFQAGWWWTLSLYVDSAVYVALALDYMQQPVGVRRHRASAIGIAIVAVFTFINIRGLELTGWTLTIIQVRVMVPLPHLHRVRHHQRHGQRVQPGHPGGRELSHLR